MTQASYTVLRQLLFFLEFHTNCFLGKRYARNVKPISWENKKNINVSSAEVSVSY